MSVPGSRAPAPAPPPRTGARPASPHKLPGCLQPKGPRGRAWPPPAAPPPAPRSIAPPRRAVDRLKAWGLTCRPGGVRAGQSGYPPTPPRRAFQPGRCNHGHCRSFPRPGQPPLPAPPPQTLWPLPPARGSRRSRDRRVGLQAAAHAALPARAGAGRRRGGLPGPPASPSPHLGGLQPGDARRGATSAAPPPAARGRCHPAAARASPWQPAPPRGRRADADGHRDVRPSGPREPAGPAVGAASLSPCAVPPALPRRQHRRPPRPRSGPGPALSVGRGGERARRLPPASPRTPRPGAGAHPGAGGGGHRECFMRLRSV